MIKYLRKLVETRRSRHLIFWISWVVGFTFIKSLGRPPEVYAGWLVYYILTLPLFVTQTYLIAYLLVPKLLDKRRWPLFLLTFGVAFYGYSVLELLVSNEWIFQWAPVGVRPEENYLQPVTVIGSGLGNLYVILVFLAVRTIRNWYLADRRAVELKQNQLQKQIENAMNRFQPKMLLDAMNRIAVMAQDGNGQVTRAIALTSELLGEVMMYNDEKSAWFTREISLVRKQLDLSALLHDWQPEVEITVVGDPSNILLPRMILFSFLDIFLRKFSGTDFSPSLHIEVSGYSRMVTVQVLVNADVKENPDLKVCMQALERLDSLFRGEVSIDRNLHPYGCTVIFRRRIKDLVSGDHTAERGVHLQESDGN